jgi:hypothetical protein
VSRKLEALKALLWRHAALTEAAFDICGKAPHWAHCFDRDKCWLEIDGDEAVLCWATSESDGYGAEWVDRNECRFPVELLLMSASEREAWKAAQLDEYNRKQAEQSRLAAIAARIQREQEERAAYEALKRKYGP